MAAKCPCPQAAPSDCSLPMISAVLGCKDVNITYLLMPPIRYIQKYELFLYELMGVAMLDYAVECSVSFSYSSHATLNIPKVMFN